MFLLVFAPLFTGELSAKRTEGGLVGDAPSVDFVDTSPAGGGGKRRTYSIVKTAFPCT